MGLIYVAKSDKSIINTTIETTLLPDTITIPANEIVAGTTFQMTMIGDYTTAAVPGTLRIRVYIGSTVVGDTSTVTPTASMSAAAVWKLFWSLSFRTSGGAAQQRSTGTILMGTSTVSALSVPNFIYIDGLTWPNLNMGSDRVLDVTAQWSTASASNSMTCRHALLDYGGA